MIADYQLSSQSIQIWCFKMRRPKFYINYAMSNLLKPSKFNYVYNVFIQNNN